jgi:hypothetical protein
VHLQDTNIGVLNLSGNDLKRLEEAGISTLEKLAGCNESALLVIPHFGTMKVRQIKANLTSYLISVLNGQRRETEEETMLTDAAAASLPKIYKKSADPAIRPAYNSRMETLSKNLNNIEERVASLESKLDKVRKNNRKNSRQVVKVCRLFLGKRDEVKSSPQLQGELNFTD